MDSTPQIHQPTSWGRTSTVSHTHTRKARTKRKASKSSLCNSKLSPSMEDRKFLPNSGPGSKWAFLSNIYSIDFLHSLTSLTWFAKCWEMCRDGLVMAPIHNRSLSKLSASDTTFLVNSHQSPPPRVYSILGEEAGKTFQRISRP